MARLAAILAFVEAWRTRLGVPLDAAGWRYLVFGLVVSLFLLVLWGLTAVLRRRRLDRELPVSHRNRAGRRALRRARAAERRGRLEEAGEAYALAGLPQRAATALVAAGKVARAAEILIAAERVREAADLYREAGKWGQAGRLYRKAGAWVDAAAMFERAGEAGEAASAWEAAGEYTRAGERYLEIGDKARATAAFERAKDRERYLEAFVGWWEEELERQLGRLEPIDVWEERLRRALEVAESLERYETVVKIASFLGEWARAARAAEAAGQWQEARRLYEKIGDPEGVARVAEAMGATDDAYRARAEAALAAGDRAEAARLYEAVGELERALELWQAVEAWADAARVAEASGRLEEAAELWQRAGQARAAAVLWERLEQWERAGEAYLAAEAYARAAEAFRRAEAWRRAAEAAERAGDTQAAIRDMQRHLRTVGQDPEAAQQLVAWMMQEGMRGAALGLLEGLVRLHPTNDREADLLYRYAMLLEEEGRTQEAVRAYERLLAYDLGYRDAAERVERLRDRVLGERTPTPFGTLDGGDTQRLQERYVVERELGRGGMGVVVKARDRILERTVALKIVQIPGVGPEAVEAVLREARATAKLNHPNIVQIYDCTLAAGKLVMAMEYVEGETLKALIERVGPLPVNALVLIFGQVARALDYAHREGIVHRDIKPANILWTPQKVVKITDFGLARAAQELANTQTVVVGSPFYMAPEQLMGEGIDHRADLYALGVTLFEAATATLPFPKGDVGYHHVHTPPPDPRQWRPDLPEPVARLILDLLAKRPEERPADAAEVLERLKAVRGGR